MGVQLPRARSVSQKVSESRRHPGGGDGVWGKMKRLTPPPGGLPEHWDTPSEDAEVDKKNVIAYTIFKVWNKLSFPNRERSHDDF